MLKRTYFVLMTLAGIGTVIWLARSHKIVKVEPTAPGQIRTTIDSTGQASHLSEGRPAGAEVPESKRHAADEIEKHRKAGSVALDQAILDQEAKVEERRKVLVTIVRTKGIIYKGPDAYYGQSGGDEAKGARSALKTYDELVREKMHLESQVNSLLKYDNEQLMVYAAGLDLPDNSIKVLYPRYLETNREFDILKKQGLGEEHPTRVAQAEQAQAIRRQLDEGVIKLRATLQTSLEMTTESLKNVELNKNNAREEAIKRGLDAQDYVDAKRDFETDQQLLQAMKLKQIKEKSGR